MQSPAAKTSLGSSTKTATTAKLTPTRKPLSTASKITPNKSPKVPTTNGAVSKTKIIAKSSVAGADSAEKAKVQTNGTAPAKMNGHIEENGTGAEKIIDVSAD